MDEKRTLILEPVFEVALDHKRTNWIKDLSSREKRGI